MNKILSLFIFLFCLSANAYATETTVYANTSDNYIYSSNASWATAHNATTGSVGTVSLTQNNCVTSFFGCHRVGSAYYPYRAFYVFDTSSIPDDDVISAVEFGVWPVLDCGADMSFCVQESTAGTSVEADDFDEFTGVAYGFGTLDMDTAAYSTLTFNSTGIAKINKTGNTFICLRDYTYDYLNSTPPEDNYTGLTFADYTGTTRDPYIKITHGAATYTLSGDGIQFSDDIDSGQAYNYAVIDTTNRTVYAYGTCGSDGSYSETVANATDDYLIVGFDTVDNLYQPKIAGETNNGQ